MSFKWVYLAAALLTVAAIVVSLPVDGGLWGAVSHIHGIVLIAIGGLLVLLARSRRPRPAVSGDEVGFTGYPEHQLFAVVDSRTEADAAIADLRDRGIHVVDIYRGDRGAAALDSEGTVHGVLSLTERSVEHLLTDLDDLSEYDAAARSGKTIIALDGRDAARRRQATGILMAHGGHDIQYFGPMSVEVLDVDRSRTRMD